MTQKDTAQSVTFRHPQVAFIAPARDLLCAVESGRWGQAAYVCAEQLSDPAKAAAALDELVAGTEYDPATVELWPASLAGETLTWQTDPGTAARALDLFQRVLMGQWRELEWVTRMASKTIPDRDVAGTLALLRHEHAAPGGFPDHPHASWSIAAAPLPARIAYHAWKQLGAGVGSPPTFSLPDRPIDVSW